MTLTRHLFITSATRTCSVKSQSIEAAHGALFIIYLWPNIANQKKRLRYRSVILTRFERCLIIFVVLKITAIELRANKMWSGEVTARSELENVCEVSRHPVGRWAVDATETAVAAAACSDNRPWSRYPTRTALSTPNWSIYLMRKPL